jgi:hypothetical protein
MQTLLFGVWFYVRLRQLHLSVMWQYHTYTMHHGTCQIWSSDKIFKSHQLKRESTDSAPNTGTASTHIPTTSHFTSRWYKFWGYVAVCMQLYCRWFTVLRLVVAVLHYMFRPTWPSSSFTFIFLKESASLFLLPFLARGYTMRISICFFVSFLILVCVFACLAFLVAARRRQHKLKTSFYNLFNTLLTVTISFNSVICVSNMVMWSTIIN